MLMMEERRRTQINMMAWAIMMVIVIVLELRGWGGGSQPQWQKFLLGRALPPKPRNT